MERCLMRSLSKKLRSCHDRTRTISTYSYTHNGVFSALEEHTIKLHAQPSSRPIRLRPRHGFSTHASPENDPEPSPQKTITLKKLIRPFLLKFHPDRQQQHPHSPTNITIAREVNLRAIQVLNGMIDTIDQICNRANSPSQSVKSGRIDLLPTYTIEFLVPSPHASDSSGVKRPKKERVSTRRSVELTFTEYHRTSIQQIDDKGQHSKKAAGRVRVRAMKEIVKLLRVAGLTVSNELMEGMERHVEEMELTPMERMLEDELNLGGDAGGHPSAGGMTGRDFQYTKRPKTERETSREKYMNSTDFEKHRKIYEEAVEDMERDMATTGLVSMNEGRKQRLVSEVISRIRIFDKSLDSAGSNDDQDQDQEEDGLDTIHQLIAIRRLSLLLEDNFDKLEMEDMGRMWENVIIVLTPERKSKKTKIGAPYSRIKRIKRGRESGFKFTMHGGDDAGDVDRVTVYVPADFEDEEFLVEMENHLSDFYSWCLMRDGFEDMFPPIYSEFKDHPTIV